VAQKRGLEKRDVESMKINRILKLFISLRGEKTLFTSFHHSHHGNRRNVIFIIKTRHTLNTEFNN